MPTDDLAASVHALKPFLPAKDFATSKRFYADLGFRVEPLGDDLAEMRLGQYSFLLQNYFVEAWGRELHDARDGHEPGRLVDAHRLARFAVPLWGAKPASAEAGALGAEHGLCVRSLRRDVALRATCVLTSKRNPDGAVANPGPGNRPY